MVGSGAKLVRHCNIEAKTGWVIIDPAGFSLASINYPEAKGGVGCDAHRNEGRSYSLLHAGGINQVMNQPAYLEKFVLALASYQSAY